MGLFGGGSKTTTSKTERPDYINNMIGALNTDIKKQDAGQYVDQQYAGLNSDQLSALGALSSNPEYNQLIQQYMGAGAQGLSNLDYAQTALQNQQRNATITPEQINQLASGLYNQDQVNQAVAASNSAQREQFSRSTMPQIAEQYNNQAGFGSGRRIANDMAQGQLINQMQATASDISNNAYNNALNQASSILSGNQQNQGAALSGLINNSSNMANLGQQASSLNNQVMQNQLNAGNLMQQNTQNQYNTNYQNAINRQNYGYNEINNLTNAASVLNGAQGQTVKTTTSGGSGMGGALTGAIAGGIQGFMMGGPYGALAGAAVGGVSGAMSQQ